ncbi:MULTISPECIES: hypothetical protein [unclassified Streptomyces]|nr:MULTISPECIES: hypothetical protein [unclassified Streptomyces]SNB89901.1 hypothetical protein SAMN02745831_06195 [Streptomyces sp. PgraA7]
MTSPKTTSSGLKRKTMSIGELKRRNDASQAARDAEKAAKKS